MKRWAIFVPLPNMLWEFACKMYVARMRMVLHPRNMRHLDASVHERFGNLVKLSRDVFA